MNFKEYIKLEEDYELFMSLNEQEWLRALAAPSLFTAGAAGNLIGQGLRGTGNILAGGARTVGGLGSAATGALQYLGSRSAKQKAKDRIKSGLGGVGSGVGKMIRGATQIAASPVTSLVRGAQATDDRGFSGILAPNDPKRSYWQDLFGLDSGNISGKNDSSRTQVSSEQKPSVPEQKPSVPEQKPSVPEQKPSVPEPSTVSDATPKEWNILVDRLRVASSKKEGEAIVAMMARKYPKLYADAVKRAQTMSRGRPSTNPSGQLRSGAKKRRPAGFPGL